MSSDLKEVNKLKKNPRRSEKISEPKFAERLIKISRVSKVTKGGKKLSFRAIVVIGDENGTVGVGVAKADDVVNAFVKATLNDFSSGIFNLGSGFSTSVIQVCRYAEKIVLNSSFLSNELEVKTDHKISDVNFWASIINTKKQLEWTPKTSLIDGINKTWMSLN